MYTVSEIIKSTKDSLSKIKKRINKLIKKILNFIFTVTSKQGNTHASIARVLHLTTNFMQIFVHTILEKNVTVMQS